MIPTLHPTCWSRTTGDRSAGSHSKRGPRSITSRRRAGEVRGNHYHARTRELFFIVSGRVEVIVENLHSGSRQAFTARKGDAFIVEPFEVHTFTTRTKAQWINMLSRRLDPDEPDFHRPRRSRRRGRPSHRTASLGRRHHGPAEGRQCPGLSARLREDGRSTCFGKTTLRAFTSFPGSHDRARAGCPDPLHTVRAHSRRRQEPALPPERLPARVVPRRDHRCLQPSEGKVRWLPVYEPEAHAGVCTGCSRALRHRPGGLLPSGLRRVPPPRGVRRQRYPWPDRQPPFLLAGAPLRPRDLRQQGLAAAVCTAMPGRTCRWPTSPSFTRAHSSTSTCTSRSTLRGTP